MQKGDIIVYTDNHKSFSWQNGLYVIHEIVDGYLRLIDLDENLEPKVDGEGEYFIAEISLLSPHIKETKLKWKI